MILAMTDTAAGPATYTAKRCYAPDPTNPFGACTLRVTKGGDHPGFEHKNLTTGQTWPVEVAS